MHILLIEDDLDLGQALLQALQLDGFTVQWLRSAAATPPVPDADEVAAVLLDQTLPDGQGMALLRRWRRAGLALPVIVITARTALQDRIDGLDGGADDYVLKPFHVPELLSRLHAVLRRSARQTSDEWMLGALRIAPRRHEAWLEEVPLALSPREFRLLLELAREPGTVIAKNVLAQRLEPLGDALDAATLEVHVSNLRKKIGAERIATVRGVGYRLQQP
ncbi:response regulator with CheY-like receiver domain and winged-helix DNA-binding domain [Acidovorax sp. CF316]|uniref:response regulator n=1 Tax=Acidovorax sp. CF316 TaxID=1144317 RepID=UPI00026BC40A|nr:response regulator [Acidovorax sp. CF316]EJE49043.1 response regulator with CheY-like receiver domain and winged-helix DNA-binding domain [Acidovorax sp. CF316]